MRIRRWPAFFVEVWRFKRVDDISVVVNDAESVPFRLFMCFQEKADAKQSPALGSRGRGSGRLYCGQCFFP